MVKTIRVSSGTTAVVNPSTTPSDQSQQDSGTTTESSDSETRSTTETLQQSPSTALGVTTIPTSGTPTNGDGDNTGGGDDTGGTDPETPAPESNGTEGVDFTRTVNEDDTYGRGFLITDFQLSDDSALHSLKISSLPDNGKLELFQGGWQPVTAGQLLAANQIVNLRYVPEANFDETDTFTVAMSADGVDFDTTPSTVSMKVVPANDAPSVSETADMTLTEGQPASVGNVIIGSFSDIDTGDMVATVTLEGVPKSKHGELTYTTAAGNTRKAEKGMELTKAEAETLVFTAASNVAADGVEVEFTYRLTDMGGVETTDLGRISMTLVDGDDAPVFSEASVEHRVKENSLEWFGKKHQATDEDSLDHLRYSLAGVDADHFMVDEFTGQIRFKDDTKPDFEAPMDANRDGSFTLDLVVTDGTGDGAKTATQAVTVMLKDVKNETAPILDSTMVEFSVVEGTVEAFTAKASDAEGGALKYSLSGGADMAAFEIDEVSGLVSFVTTPDHEAPLDYEGDNVYEVQVTAADEDGNVSAPVDFKVSVTDDGPQFDKASKKFKRPEGDTDWFGAKHRASDDESYEEIRYSLAGVDAGHFEVDPYTGQVRFKEGHAPDFEAPNDYNRDGKYQFDVIATEHAGDGAATAAQAIEVVISNVVNEHPPVLGPAEKTLKISESHNLATAVYVATTTDEDAVAAGVTFSLDPDSPDAAAFEISPATGELKFKASYFGEGGLDFDSPMDMDGDNKFHVTVIATDDGAPALMSSIDLVIRLQDVDDEDPEVPGETVTVDFVENGEGIVFTASVEDVDTSDGFAYRISGGADAKLFSIDEKTGEVSFIDSPDREEPHDTNGNNVYKVRIQVEDGGGNLSEETLYKVEVTNVDDSAPAAEVIEDLNDSDGASLTNLTPGELAASVREDVVVGSELLDLGYTDGEWKSDLDENVTYEIVGDSSFSVDAETGVVSLSEALSFDEAKLETLTLRVTDSGDTPMTATTSIEISILDANEAPTLTRGMSVTNVTEGLWTQLGTVDELAALVGYADPEGQAAMAPDDGIFGVLAEGDEIRQDDDGTYLFRAGVDSVREEVTFSLTLSDGENSSNSVDVNVSLTDMNTGQLVIMAERYEAEVGKLHASGEFFRPNEIDDWEAELPNGTAIMDINSSRPGSFGLEQNKAKLADLSIQYADDYVIVEDANFSLNIVNWTGTNSFKGTGGGYAQKAMTTEHFSVEDGILYFEQTDEAKFANYGGVITLEIAYDAAPADTERRYIDIEFDAYIA